MNWPQYRYFGDGREPEIYRQNSPSEPEPYLPGKELIQAVNLAIYLERPLLLEGEAGSGKSRLASAVAYELGLPLYTWSVRSTSKVEEGLYKYDPLLRLYDVQTLQAGLNPAKLERDPTDAKSYRVFREIGEAFNLKDYPAVVLIDEIDKADIDFPNDLLNILDEPREFTIRETGEVINATHSPIVIITSNKEKGNLPMPFLRRCVYHLMRFPDEEMLKQIIKLHFEKTSTNQIEDNIVSKAIHRFTNIRNSGVQKKPGTSELIDWVSALHVFRENDEFKKLDDEKSIPFPEVLLKLRVDMLHISNASI